jgi:CubicO group peptidase (beta-lactamase class C family)
MHLLDTPIVQYVDKGRWQAWHSNEQAKKITLRHLLTHTSGLLGNDAFAKLQPNGIDGDSQFGGKNDINEAIRQLQLVEGKSTPPKEPGKHYDYSNPGAQAVAAVLSELLGQRKPPQTPAGYVKERIFDKLGMTGTDLDIFQSGEPCLYGGMRTTALDLACVGQMLSQGGMWKGHPFISTDALAEMLTSQVGVKEGSSHLDYAHLWSMNGDSTSPGYSICARGDHNNYLHIFPNEKLIFVRLQTFYKADIEKITA